MVECKKCGRTLYLIDIEIRKSKKPHATKTLIPHLDKIFMCPRCEIKKTKGL